MSVWLTGPTANAATQVAFGVSQQTIDGFGAADRNVGKLTTPQADFFFDASTGLGFSLLRRGIETDGTPSSDGVNTDLYANASAAVARGAKIFCVPWSAPGAWKDNGLDTDGGHLLTGHYSDWATRLANVQAGYQSNASCNVYAIGVQNEPDFTASYESMLYTTSEMVNFIKNNLGPALAALTPVPVIVGPETANWDNAAAYVSAIEADATANGYFSFAGAHQYSGTPASVSNTHRTWQTEMSGLPPATFDGSMSDALTVAGWIHSAMVVGTSAWFYWELIGASDDNQGVIGKNGDGSFSTKRSYAMGNYSRFIRPGWVRVSAMGSVSGVSLTAYRNPSTKDFAIVAINTNGTNTAFSASLGGITVSTCTPYRTSASEDLAALSAVSVTGNRLNAVLAASSVTTFTGTGA